MTKTNTTLLVNQINKIKFDDGTNVKYLPPKKSYNMLGVQINSMLDFRDHLKHVTMDVQLIAKVLTKRKLSPCREKLMIDQLLHPNTTPPI